MRARHGITLLALAPVVGALSFSVPASAHVADPSGDMPRSPQRVVEVKATPRPAKPPAPRVMTVRPGDTLWALGIASGRTWAQLAGFNHLPNPDLIMAGLRLVVPPANYAPPPQPVVVAPTPSYAPQAASAPAVTYQPPAPVSQPVVAAQPVSGGSGGFQACVMFRESTNGAGSPNLYGILPSTWSSLGLGGSPYTASRAQQDSAFATLYARDGASPWAPYDGC